MRGLLILASMAALLCPRVIGGSDQTFSWPEVQSLSKTYNFEGLPGAEPTVDLNILDLAGGPAYRLLCHSGDYAGVTDLQYPNENFDFIGAFDCHLFALKFRDQKLFELLMYDPLSIHPTLSRAPLMGQEIAGGCAKYPEYGAERRFRLRGMEILFRYSDIVFSIDPGPSRLPVVRSFRFEINVTPESSAVTSISNRVEVEYPTTRPNGGLDCTHVLRSHVLGLVTAEYVAQENLGPPFPTVKAVQKQGVVGSGPEEQIFSLPIESEAGDRAYLLKCAYQGMLGIDCGLYEPTKSLNLLADSVDPYSGLTRSLVRPWQLYGSCANYPDWGSVRVFNLRHLRIELRFTEAELTSGSEPPDDATDAITKVHVAAQVIANPKADSPVAAPPKYGYWRYLPIETGCHIPILAPQK